MLAKAMLSVSQNAQFRPCSNASRSVSANMSRAAPVISVASKWMIVPARQLAFRRLDEPSVLER